MSASLGKQNMTISWWAAFGGGRAGEDMFWAELLLLLLSLLSLQREGDYREYGGMVEIRSMVVGCLGQPFCPKHARNLCVHLFILTFIILSS